MWYLATNEVDVFHYGMLEEGFVLTSGQPVVLYFDSQSELEEELEKYGQEYIDPSTENTLPPEPPEN
jgi:hypothetical protein